MPKITSTTVGPANPVVISEILRAAIYSRVSTEMEIQQGSFEEQNKYFKKRIDDDSTLILVGEYGDFGVSGRSIKGRDQFNQMVQDCVDGKIDIVFTKNISRFARNFVDCMTTIKILKEHNVRIIFDEDGIDTGDVKSELLLQILASIAEEESNSISENVQWAIDERAKNGTPFTHAAYGYRRAKRTSIWTIEEKEAEHVRFAFNCMIDGWEYHQIRDKLNDMEKDEGTGKVWSSGMVKGMLMNIAYIGDILTGRFVKVGKKSKRNEGEKEQYYLKDHHEAIIERDTFEIVQKIIATRSAGFLRRFKKLAG